MPKRLGMTIVCLHISAVLYVAIGILMYMLLQEQVLLAVLFAVFSIALAVGVEVVVSGLKNKRFWAWVAGIIICGTYVPSLFMILGALGLWGLLDSETRAVFLNSSGKNMSN